MQKPACCLLNWGFSPIAMRRLLLAAAALCLLLPAQEKRQKAPDVEIVQVRIHRIDDQLIAVDGSLRNTSQRNFQRIQVVFEFFAPGKQSITIQRGAPEPDTITPGDLTEFHLQLRAPARAVHVLLGVEDGSGRELRVGNAGPFPVE